MAGASLRLCFIFVSLAACAQSCVDHCDATSALQIATRGGAKAPGQCEWNGPCNEMFQFSAVRAACGDRAVCAASDCLACRWGTQGARRPCASPPAAAARPACPARGGSATTGAGEQEPGCVQRMGLHVHPEQQLRGEIVDAVCHQMQQAKTSTPEDAANVLIFSLGYDSPMWLDMNPRGLTRFVETHEEWIEKQPPRVQENAMRADYGTTMSESWDIRCDYDRLGRFLEANPELRSTCWDIIVVDAPEGFGHGPGRMGSIYAASQLAGPDTVVFVDDCEREVEANYTMWYLSEGRDLRVIDNGHGGVTCMSYPSKA